MTKSKHIDDYSKIIASYDPAQNKTSPLMTKYEFNQLISLRMLHLSKGAPPFLDGMEDLKIKSNTELRKIAVQELLEGKMPYIVRRMMPNGKPEYWRIKDMDLTAVRVLF